MDLGYVPILAQLGDDFFSNREGAAEKCPGNNGLCLGWFLLRLPAQSLDLNGLISFLGV